MREYIEENLNPMIAKKEALEYTAATSGGEEPVADVPCIECGKSVSYTHLDVYKRQAL